MNRQPRVVIVGAGFGGLRAARSLAGAPVTLQVVDRSNHHLFQPLLYQVATATLSPASIAYPIRSAVRGQRNCEVILGEVVGIDRQKREVLLSDRRIPFDYLVLATGARHSYFGKDNWEPYAPGIKTIPDATRIRQRILFAFEKAEMEADPKKREAYLTFCIVGGGPTGVELAGAIAELARRALEADFRHIDPASSRILLLEAGPRLLATFPERLSQEAQRRLERLGVVVRTGSRVQRIEVEGVQVGEEWIPARTMIWAAGVIASPVARWLRVEGDRNGRVVVTQECTLPGDPKIFVIGDAAHFEEKGNPLPGVAPVAMQQGSYVARTIRSDIKGTPRKAFHYFNKGNLATIGRKCAVADLGRIHLTGWIAWIAWTVVHIYYLIGFRNRLSVIIDWAWNYITFQRGARIITEEPSQIFPKESEHGQT